VEEATDGEAHISVRDIQRAAPWLSRDRIPLIMRFYGHPMVKFHYAGDEKECVINSYRRKGFHGVIHRFLQDSSRSVSHHRNTLLVRHPAFEGQVMRVSKERAIEHLGMTEADFAPARRVSDE
jgi:hypothetical protein